MGVQVCALHLWTKMFQKGGVFLFQGAQADHEMRLHHLEL